jgi:hypothetical protein
VTLRKLLIISLIFLHLIANTDLIEVFSLGKLISHFQEHKKSNPTVSFIDFLNMHYIGDDGNTTDDNKDMELPFHHPNVHSFDTVIYSLPQTGTIKNNQELFYLNKPLANRFKIYIQQNYLSTLLQPPRI